MPKLANPIAFVLLSNLFVFPCLAQTTQFARDDFSDGDHQDHEPFNWQKGSWPGGELFADDDNLMIENCLPGGCAIAHKLSSGNWNTYRDVSFRLQARVIEGNGAIVPWGRWTNSRGYYGSVRPFSDEIVIGIGEGSTGTETATADLILDEERDVVLKFDMIGDEYSLSAWNAGDDPRELPLISDKDSQFRQGILGVSLFTDETADIAYRWIEIAEILPGDVDTNSIIDVDDIDYLTTAVNDRSESNRYDTDRDGDVDADDRTTWVHDIKQTWFGDANLDGEFNSSDFVAVFEVGKFELDEHASWSEGDWDGDGKFNSGDFVIAFQDGGFEAGPKVAAVPVPEPSGLAVACWLISIVAWRRLNG